MLLAAGLGKRMRPLTDDTAKPLLTLAGRSLLDYGLDRLAAVGVDRVVVNAHWCAERVAARLDARAADGEEPETTLRHEDTLLETGGGVKAALAELGEEPFYVVNGDTFWLDGPRPALARLAAAFDDGATDAVLLVHRGFGVPADVGYGDFALDKWGVPRRRGEREVVPYIYAGAQIVHPRLLDGMPDGAFSMNLPWDRAMAAGRLRAVVHDGLWLHLSTPADLTEAESLLHHGALGGAR
jgi:MurNAc alpha-1-phosphate uridylyltransferase